MRYLETTTYLLTVLAAATLGACSTPAGDGQECTPDTTFCEQNTVRKCTTDGTDSVLVQVCQFDCNAGTCVSFTSHDTTADDLTLPQDIQPIDDAMEELVAPLDVVTDETVPPLDLVTEDVMDEDLPADDTPDLIEPCSHACAVNDFYCVGIKEIHYCVDGPDGCRIWDDGASCDDGNACTDDACAADKGCVTANNKEACDDGDPCTGPDLCSGGECVGEAGNCGCQTDADCVALEDGNFCNGTLICMDTECVVDQQSIVSCNGQVGPCVEEVCDPGSGTCQDKWLPNGTGCDDANQCTTGESCQNGSCTNGAQTNCDDANPCTEDLCNPGAGCSHEDFADGTVCGNNKECVNGDCVAANVPVELAGNLDSPFDLAIDESFVYFIEDDNVNGTVKKVPLGGGVVTTLAANLPEPRAIAIDGGNVFWIERNGGSNGSIGKVSKNGGNPVSIATGLKNAQNQLEHADGFLYFGDGKQGGGGVIKKVGVNGGTTILVEGNGLLNLNTAVGVHKGQVYFRNDYDKVLRVSVNGGAVSSLGDGEPSAYAITDSYIFFTEYSNGRVMRMPLGGGSATVLASNTDSAANLVVDANYVYWITDTNKGEVKRVGIMGGGEKTYSNQANTRGIAVDNDYVYYAVSVYSNQGKIMRVAK
jgi:hypothetical protein